MVDFGDVPASSVELFPKGRKNGGVTSTVLRIAGLLEAGTHQELIRPSGVTEFLPVEIVRAVEEDRRKRQAENEERKGSPRAPGTLRPDLRNNPLLSEVLLVSNQSGAGLLDDISARLGLKIAGHQTKVFGNCDRIAQLDETVSNKHVVIVIGETSAANMVTDAVNFADAARRHRAKTITCLMPFIACGRQDKSIAGTRQSITAKIVLRQLESAGISNLLTLDMHAPNTADYVNTLRVNNIFASPILVPFLREFLGDDLKNCVTWSPDKGGVDRAISTARSLLIQYAGFSDKIKIEGSNGIPTVKTIRLFKDASMRSLRDKIILVPDDMSDTGNTAVSNSRALRKRFKPAKIILVAAHPVFSDRGCERVLEARMPDSKELVFDGIVTTDSCGLVRPSGTFASGQFLQFVPAGSLLSTALYYSILGDSITDRINEQPFTFETLAGLPVPMTEDDLKRSDRRFEWTPRTDDVIVYPGGPSNQSILQS